jgi:hypothetical protein
LNRTLIRRADALRMGYFYTFHSWFSTTVFMWLLVL